jgi:protein TonB
MTSRKTRLLRFVPIAGIAALSLVAIGIVILIKQSFQGGPPPHPRVQQITLVAPPPPPPPPKVEQPPEPEIEKVQIPETPPDQSPPAGADLGVDADGSAGGDGFGLVGKKGGRSLLDGGPFGWYTSFLKTSIRDLLAEHKNVRRKQYNVVLSLWISKEGHIERVEVIRPTGNRELDTNIKVAVASLGRMSEPPPGDMPQPVRVKISSHL